jgi:hypothetical protein
MTIDPIVSELRAALAECLELVRYMQCDCEGCTEKLKRAEALLVRTAPLPSAIEETPR